MNGCLSVNRVAKGKIKKKEKNKKKEKDVS